MRWRQTDYPVSTYIFDKLPNRRLEKFCELVFKAEKVVLVVPKPYISSYPRDRQHRIWTLSKFIEYVQEVESVEWLTL